MAKSRSVNYARAKSHWGSMPGTIQIHTVEGLGSSNDPTTAVFKVKLIKNKKKIGMPCRLINYARFK